MVTIRILRDDWADQAVELPAYATAGAAGADVRANLPGDIREAGITIPPGGRALVPTGLRMEIPEGWEVQLRPRSGLALKNGITLPNTPGTIDSDYRGPVGVILANISDEPFLVEHGARIAQLIAAPVVQAFFETVTDLSETERGAGGFGSTGVK